MKPEEINKKRTANLPPSVWQRVLIIISLTLIFFLVIAGFPTFQLNLYMVVGMILAGILVGNLFWRMLVLFTPHLTLVKAILAGALAGLLAHPLIWSIVVLCNYLLALLTSSYQATLNPTEALGWGLAFAWVTLLHTGWLTALIGALSGGIYANWLLVQIPSEQHLQEHSQE
ncbi:MAG: hypothetical protein OEZ02_08615 [Anaerolineae bacterium]|nr:hypothetical protein [Anaerolineae bacterium]